jgi:hypothetical protein
VDCRIPHLEQGVPNGLSVDEYSISLTYQLSLNGMKIYGSLEVNSEPAAIPCKGQ